MSLTDLPTPRRRLLEEVASRVPVLAADVVRVGVDGVDGAGKTVFAGHLADVLRKQGRSVVRVSADDFLNPAAIRHRRGRHDPRGFWLDSYDYPALRHRVLDPLAPGGSRRYQVASHDPACDQAVNPPVYRAEASAVLVLDGLFLHREELAGVWDLSIFLRASFAVSVARTAARDGGHPDPDHLSQSRYVRGQQLYFAACQPWQRADLVIDVTDLDAPVLVVEL